MELRTWCSVYNIHFIHDAIRCCWLSASSSLVVDVDIDIVVEDNETKLKNLTSEMTIFRQLENNNELNRIDSIGKYLETIEIKKLTNASKPFFLDSVCQTYRIRSSLSKLVRRKESFFSLKAKNKIVEIVHRYCFGFTRARSASLMNVIWQYFPCWANMCTHQTPKKNVTSHFSRFCRRHAIFALRDNLPQIKDKSKIPQFSSHCHNIDWFFHWFVLSLQ